MTASKSLTFTVKALLLAGAVTLVTGCSEADMKQANQNWDMFRKTYTFPKGYHYNLQEQKEPYSGPKLYIPPPPAQHTVRPAMQTIPETAGTYIATTTPPEIQPYTGYELAPPPAYDAVTRYSVTSTTPISHPPANTGSGQWSSVANDLVTRLFSSIGTPSEGVYLMAENSNNLLNRPFGAALEQTLASQGVTVSKTTDTAGYALWYSATDMSSYGGNEVQLELFLLSGNNVAAEASAAYPLTGGGMASYPAEDIGYIDSTTHPAGQKSASSRNRPLSLLP